MVAPYCEIITKSDDFQECFDDDVTSDKASAANSDVSSEKSWYWKGSVGKTKNQHSRRVISFLPVMREILEEQLKICTQLNSDVLFCTNSGTQVQRDNLRGRVWEPALEKAERAYRPMMQTRHSFATIVLSSGENPLWIAKVMGHSTTRMVIDVYAKYIENLTGVHSFIKKSQKTPKNEMKIARSRLKEVKS